MYKVIARNQFDEKVFEFDFTTEGAAQQYMDTTPGFRHELYNVAEARFMREVYRTKAVYPQYQYTAEEEQALLDAFNHRY